MNGKAGGNPATLTGPENVPDERDYHRPNSVSQEIFEGHSDSCQTAPGPAQPRHGHPPLVSILFILFHTTGALREPITRSDGTGTESAQVQSC